VDFSSAQLLIAALFLALAATVYGRLFRQVAEAGGKVRTAEFGLPDILICTVLCGFFVMLITQAVLQPQKDAGQVSVDQILPGALLFIFMLLGVGGFLRYRGIDLRRLFGFDNVPLLRALGRAAGLVLAAFPLVALAGLLTQWLLESRDDQELVKLFREVAARADLESVLKIGVAGVIVAPVAEEFLFRGYFYGRVQALRRASRERAFHGGAFCRHPT
jgi:membrane protease YdiL (CAAX protease family)